MATFVDHKLKLTYDDLRLIPEDDPFRHEVLDGVHVASPSPVYRHQTISRRIQFQLYEQIELAGLGQVVNAPMDIELGTHDVVEPDVFVILEDNEQIITETHVRGAPDLIIEILSPSTSGRDLGIKKERYEFFGVPEYWVVDPEAGTVRVFTPAAGSRLYGEPEVQSEMLTFSARGVTATVDLNRVW
ncbi:MAG: Uma2 family endonuclease [Spirochaetia bacterium]